MVTKILSVDDLIVPAQAAFLAEKFGFSVAYPISKLPAEEQLVALTAKRNDGTRDELVRQVKKVRSRDEPRCTFPNERVCLRLLSLTVAQVEEFTADMFISLAQSTDLGTSA